MRPVLLLATASLLSGCNSLLPSARPRTSGRASSPPLQQRRAPPDAAAQLASDAAGVMQVVLDDYQLSSVNLASVLRIAPLREDAVLTHRGTRLEISDTRNWRSAELEHLAVEDNRAAVRLHIGGENLSAAYELRRWRGEWLVSSHDVKRTGPSPREARLALQNANLPRTDVDLAMCEPIISDTERLPIRGSFREYVRRVALNSDRQEAYCSPSNGPDFDCTVDFIDDDEPLLQDNGGSIFFTFRLSPNLRVRPGVVCQITG